MTRTEHFVISDAYVISSEVFAIHVPSGISSVDELLQAIYDGGHLPGYFGVNWNALSDCLRDFHWVECRQVVLVHRDVPSLPADQLDIYIDILAECVADWRPEEEHSLTVVFPDAARTQLEDLERIRTVPSPLPEA